MCTESGAERPAVNPNPEVIMPSTKRDKARQAREALAHIPAQLAALEKMSVAELRERWLEVYGQPTTAGNKAYLKKRLAWRIQELAEGGLSDRAKARIEELVADAPIRWRTPKPDDDEPAKAYRDVNLSGVGTPGPGLTALLADIEAGDVDHVVVTDWSRLGRTAARTAHVQAVVQRAGCRLTVAEGQG